MVSRKKRGLCGTSFLGLNYLTWLILSAIIAAIVVTGLLILRRKKHNVSRWPVNDYKICPLIPKNKGSLIGIFEKVIKGIIKSSQDMAVYLKLARGLASRVIS